MVKFNFIHQKACLMNWNHETYNIKQQFIKSLTRIKLRPFEMFFFFFSQIQLYFLPNSVSNNFLDPILMVNINNQKHL